MKRKTKAIFSIAFAILSVTSLCLSLLLPSTKAEQEKAMQTIVSTATTGTGASTADASKKGGGIFLEPDSQFTMAGGTISGHTRDYGGAVYVSSGAIFTMTGGTISSNGATFGGAVYVEAGGEFYFQGGTITLNNATFGGAIYIESGAKCYISGGTISSNTGTAEPAIYYEDGATLQITAGTIGPNEVSGTQTLETPTCTLNGDIITIGEVSGALGYRVEIKNEDNQQVLSFVTQETQIDLSNYDIGGGTFNVEVTAIGTFATCSDKAVVEYYIYKEITLTIWILKWDASGEPEGYEGLPKEDGGIYQMFYSLPEDEDLIYRGIEDVRTKEGIYMSNKIYLTAGAGTSWAEVVEIYKLRNYLALDSGHEGVYPAGEYWNQSTDNPVFTKDTEIIFYKKVCFDSETLVECYDEKRKRRYKKKLKDITYKDKLVVWNFDKGCFDIASPLFITKEQQDNRYTEVTFSDGNVVRYAGPDDSRRHRILNIETGKFEYVGHEGTPIGTSTLNDKGEIVKVVGIKFVDKPIKYMNIITKYHINCFAGGIIASDRMANIYPIKDLKYVKDNRPLATYEDYPEIEKEYFDGLRLAEQPSNIRRAENDVTYYNNYTEFVTKLKEMSKPRD